MGIADVIELHERLNDAIKPDSSILIDDYVCILADYS